MNIPIDKAETFLKRIDLCSVEAAIVYAKKTGRNYTIWKTVFERSDFQKYILETLSVKDAIIYAGSLSEFYIWNDIWKAVLERKDVQEYLLKTLSAGEAILYAKDIQDFHIWEIIATRTDVINYLFKELSPTEAVAYAKNINNFRVWVVIFQRNDIPLQKIISYAKEIEYSSEIWETIFNREDVQQYLLSTLSPIEVIVYAQNVNYWRIWNYIFDKRDDLPLKEAILAYSKREEQKGYGGDFEHWGNVEYGVNGMRQYLLKIISAADALNFAKEVNYWKVWEIVLRRNDIAPKQAIICANEIKHTEVWEAVLGRSDISSSEALAIASEIDDPQVWKIVLEK